MTRAGNAASGHGIPPLSSWYDFCLVAAWFLAAAYVVLTLRRPQNAVGIFVLPLVLLLVGLAVLVRDWRPFNAQTALYLWRLLHSFALLAGTTVVALGFATGLMYLIQSYRLKHKLPPRRGFQLPSLEWLQDFNRDSLIVSSCLLGIGFLAGVMLNVVGFKEERGSVAWTDPVVLVSGSLFVWLVGRPVRIVLQARPSGQKDSLSGDGQFSLSGIGAVLRLLWSTRRAMKLRVVGCSHHQSSVEARERLAFSPEQTGEALSGCALYSQAETVLLSTCNRVEFYFAAAEPYHCPASAEVAKFVADFHGLDTENVFQELFEANDEQAVRHLFMVAASLDSMVVGEAQILSQVKQAYEQAMASNVTGPLTHSVFQAAIRVAKRVARETTINQKRVSIPSVAVADFAKQLFERFDDKQVLVVGAGEMGEETLRYLIDEEVAHIAIINRSQERAEDLAARLTGQTYPWEALYDQVAAADLVISTTGASEPVITLEQFRRILHRRSDRPLFALDLAVPRDFAPGIGDLPGVYLYSLDDLQQACEANRRDRAKEWPKAARIVEDETARFLAELNHRATRPRSSV